jgi:DNA-binding XRE family transcriptional regulator
MTKAQVNRRLANYLRTHRRNAGLTQPELGHILGHCNEGPVLRHERFQATPSLVVALGYEIIFRAPVSEIFAGLRDEVEEHVEERLAAFENDLQQRSAKGRNADAIARKLTWLSERRISWGNESRE